MVICLQRYEFFAFHSPFSSFFSNEVKAAFFLFAIVMDMVVNKDALVSYMFSDWDVVILAN